MVWGSNANRGKRFFSSPKHLDWLWGLPSCIFDANQGPFPDVKGLGYDVEHPHPSNTKAKNEWIYTSPHPTSVNRDKVNFHIQ